MSMSTQFLKLITPYDAYINTAAIVAGTGFLAGKIANRVVSWMGQPQWTAGMTAYNSAKFQLAAGITAFVAARFISNLIKQIDPNSSNVSSGKKAAHVNGPREWGELFAATVPAYFAGRAFLKYDSNIVVPHTASLIVAVVAMALQYAISDTLVTRVARP